MRILFATDGEAHSARAAGLLERLAEIDGLVRAPAGELAHPAHETVEQRGLRLLPLGELPHAAASR